MTTTRPIWNLSGERVDELARMTLPERLAARGANESWMDAFCTTCGAFIWGDGAAIGKFFCSACAAEAGVDCAVCGCDGGSGAGGYSNCCGGRMGGVE